jgi:hypothetical protein
MSYESEDDYSRGMGIRPCCCQWVYLTVLFCRIYGVLNSNFGFIYEVDVYTVPLLWILKSTTADHEITLLLQPAIPWLFRAPATLTGCRIVSHDNFTYQKQIKRLIVRFIWLLQHRHLHAFNSTSLGISLLLRQTGFIIVTNWMDNNKGNWVSSARFVLYNNHKNRTDDE